jgi:hypothetical protein
MEFNHIEYKISIAIFGGIPLGREERDKDHPVFSNDKDDEKLPEIGSISSHFEIASVMR